MFLCRKNFASNSTKVLADAFRKMFQKSLVINGEYIVEISRGIIKDLCVKIASVSEDMYIKIFSEGPMVDKASESIASCTVFYAALPMKTDSHFQPTMS